MALTININLAAGEVPFTADDFLGMGNRAERVAAKLREDLRVRQMNAVLCTAMPRAYRPGDPVPDIVPLWARRDPPRPTDPTPQPQESS